LAQPQARPALREKIVVETTAANGKWRGILGNPATVSLLTLLTIPA
jgi:hypothetical protein